MPPASGRKCSAIAPNFDHSEVEDRAVAAYLGLALGDALGATVEFMTPREISAAYGVHKEIIGGGWLRLPPGEVTDDTTMSVALGNAILEAGEVRAVDAAKAFDGWMRGKPVDIGNTVRRGILHFRRSGEPCVPPNPHDGGNGACMRSLPVALATLNGPPEEIQRAVLAQAHVTHNHPLSDQGTLCIVRMVQLALSGSDRKLLLNGPVAELIAKEPAFNFRKRRCENPTGFIVHTLRVVFEALFDTDTFEECLVEAVNRGGDADTTGAIAGMVAGALYGREAIPPRWLKALRPGVRESCERQARQLLQLALA